MLLAFSIVSVLYACHQRVGAWRSRGVMEPETVKPLKNLIKSKKFNLSRKTPIAPNPCVCPASAGHTPKAFQIVQKYKFGLQKLIFGV
ncbi:hypothetical protein, partial [Flavobacterium filum]|uniref:hypothetical protein n=1 Tax=Flavobacterium filum TaxID=370974 RepID=UPI001B7FC8BD